MARNLAFLIVGVAAGMILMAALEKSHSKRGSGDPRSLADQISDQLQSLESRLHTA